MSFPHSPLSSHAFFHHLSRYIPDPPDRIELQINPPPCRRQPNHRRTRCFHSPRCRTLARISGKDFPLPLCTGSNHHFLICFFYPLPFAITAFSFSPLYMPRPPSSCIPLFFFRTVFFRLPLPRQPCPRRRQCRPADRRRVPRLPKYLTPSRPSSSSVLGRPAERAALWPPEPRAPRKRSRGARSQGTCDSHRRIRRRLVTV
ncbi:hypothetical protein BJV78DRAFT_790012 [Lactifluus subvellereus]|nr:hypothetical protein BJV78DRAFT_790012 [Lactifluus subvellereus]